jgi:peptidoglycan hydrolase CwlO-like protein
VPRFSFSCPFQSQLASLSPEQEAKRYQLRRQVEDLDDLIRSKTDTKRAVEKEIEALLSQKRGYVWEGGREEYSL